MLEVGQAILGRICYPDGSTPEYSRPYLIVFVSESKVGVLIVSSTKGKERKLIYKTNKRLKKYKPPFLKDSFVKLESLTYIKTSDALSMKLLYNGEKLDRDELKEILDEVPCYSVCSLTI